MSGPLGAPGLLMAGGVRTGVPIANSCRFNDDDNTHTSRTTGTTPTSRDIQTISVWVKRGEIGSGAQNTIFSGYNDANNESTLWFNVNDKLEVYNYVTGYEAQYISTAVFRDPSAWYHIVCVIDTSEGTAADRVKLWVNGVQITAWDTATTSALNADWHFSGGGYALTQYVGERGADSLNFDGYMAELHVVDGTAYTATDFGEFNPEGHWIPKTVNVSYGTEGFHLDFAVAPGTGNGAGTDVSGNANHLTDSGLAANDQVSDTPTKNYCTGNTAVPNSASVSNGNLRITGDGAANWLIGTQELTGKRYWEVTCVAGSGGNAGAGITSRLNNGDLAPGSALGHASTRSNEGNFYVDGVTNGGTGDPFGAFTATDVLMFAFDADADKLWIGKNGTWFNSGDPAAGTGAVDTTARSTDGYGPYFPAWGGFTASTDTMEANFGQSAFAHTAPTGFKELNVTTLDDPTHAPIPKGSDYFDIVTYAGTSAQQSVTGLDFASDMVWIKNRDTAYHHTLQDSVRGWGGATKITPNEVSIEDDATNADGKYGYVESIEADGFTLNGDNTPTYVQTNVTGENYVAWCWKEAVKAGFDIVTYAGTGVEKQVAHNLSATPGSIFVKNRDQADSWLGLLMDTLDVSTVPIADPETDYVLPDNTTALGDDNTMWNDTAPDADDFTVLSHHSCNASAENYVAYVWREVPGFSRFGSYLGGGSTDGAFVWCGFRPRWLLIKNLHAAVSWMIYDSARDTYNPVDLRLAMDATAIEASSDNIDFLANGFKCRTNAASTNGGSTEYAFMAFAEHPFKYARAF